ncbi:class I SAM-dependent methyltransferase [Kribbella shirazensis]|uniref:SAM-dependent methyltransferase n=1 Tax=Kribbella shirazensis TaxID=1105143 RepID=A0A7X5VB34_9ACTN|nr:class I SAM-dependent methyltransferase [Kribbella shirazensis]NIK57955.1 SAM-dependent methyltransferase [Kribbella shirazensis]
MGTLLDVTLDAQTQQMVAANEADWNARAPLHAASDFYDRPAEFWFADYEWADLGPLEGRDVLHLQCHLGTETIEFARRGARASGLDLSEKSLEAAREIAGEAGIEVDYLHANVYDAAEAVGGRQFDIVYTGKGALCYLPELKQWAEVVRDLLKPGGVLYIVEFHPLLNSLREVSLPGESDELVLRADYLEGRGPIAHDSTVTYTGDEVPGRRPATSGATASAKSSPPSRAPASRSPRCVNPKYCPGLAGHRCNRPPTAGGASPTTHRVSRSSSRSRQSDDPRGPRAGPDRLLHRRTPGTRRSRPSRAASGQTYGVPRPTARRGPRHRPRDRLRTGP